MDEYNYQKTNLLPNSFSDKRAILFEQIVKPEESWTIYVHYTFDLKIFNKRWKLGDSIAKAIKITFIQIDN